MSEKQNKDCDIYNLLPDNVKNYIELVVKNIRYRKKIRNDVRAELIAHFEDALKDYTTPEEKQTAAQSLIDDFGDPKTLATLTRRAKKRCRPLWKKFIIRSCQAIGLLILVFIIYTAWFLTGKPKITTDYLAEYNRLARPTADDSLNAEPFYAKAAELTIDIPEDLRDLTKTRIEDINESNWAIINDWVNSNQPALDQIKLGNQKPYFWQEYSSDSGELMGVLMPNLSKYKSIAYALCFQAKINARNGDLNNALDNIIAAYNLGKNLKGGVTLVEQLVAMATESMSTSALRQIISEYDIDPAQLESIQSLLTEITKNEDFTVNFNCEKLFMLDEIQRCFTDDCIGGGHLYPKRTAVLFDMGGESTPTSYIQKALFLVRPVIQFSQPNKNQTRLQYEQLYDYMNKLASLTPAQQKAQNLNFEDEFEKFASKNILISILTPAVDKVIELGCRNEIEAYAAITTLAIMRYHADLGQYPDTLEQLIETGYLTDLPIDPYSGNPLIYKKTPAGFTLYSVGKDFEDNAGKSGLPIYYDWRTPWPKDPGYDAVFWPIATKQENN